MGRFNGATVLISGATGGLGCGAARAFAAEGARLVLSDLNEAALADFTATLDAQTAILAGNIADEKLSEDLVKLAVEKFGRLDIAVNNAGIVDLKARVDEMSVERLERMMRINVVGSFLCAREAVKRMSTRHGGKGGAIVNISSAAARLGSPGE
ncbi:MAG: SDR family oxidoreductase, partial [Mesorhizobium sp.]